MAVHKNNYRRLRSYARDLIYINTALCDEVSKISQKISKIENENMHLLKELLISNPKLRRELLSDGKLFGLDKSKEGVRGGRSELRSRHKKNKKTKNSLINHLPTSHVPVKPKKHLNPPIDATSTPTNEAPHRASLVPLDPHGRPVFPVKLDDESLIVYSIGEISSQPSFHTHHCIYPIGYCSTRLFQSINPTGLSSSDAPSIDTCLYTCKVSEASGKPKFEIIAEDCTGITFVGNSPDDCSNKLCHTMSQFWEDHAEGISINGGWFFGLTHPTIKNFLQCMPGAKKCSNYKAVKYEIVKETPKPGLDSEDDGGSSQLNETFDKDKQDDIDSIYGNSMNFY